MKNHFLYDAAQKTFVKNDQDDFIINFEIDRFDYQFQECQGSKSFEPHLSYLWDYNVPVTSPFPYLKRMHQIENGIWFYVLPNKDFIRIEYNQENRRAFYFSLPDFLHDSLRSPAVPCYEFSEKNPYSKDQFERRSSCLFQQGEVSFGLQPKVLNKNHLLFGFSNTLIMTQLEK